MERVRQANSLPKTVKVPMKDIGTEYPSAKLFVSCLLYSKCCISLFWNRGEKRVPSQEMYAAMLRALGPDGELRSAKTKIGKLEATQKQNEIKIKIKYLLDKQSSKGKEPASSSSTASTSSGLKQFYQPSTKPVSMFSRSNATL